MTTSKPDPAARYSTRVSAVLAATGCATLGVLSILGTGALGLPLLAPAVLVVLVCLPVLVLRPNACLVLAGIVEFANVYGVAATNGLPGVYLAVLGLAAVSLLLALVRGLLQPAWSPVLTTAFLLLAVQALAAVSGDDPENSLQTVVETVKHVVWLVLLLMLLLTSAAAPRVLARSVAGTLTALSALVLVQALILNDATDFAGFANVPLSGDLGAATARHAGPQIDVNFWGRILVLGLPFALSLAQMAASRIGALLWVGAALTIWSGVVLTGSRGAILAVFPVVCLWLLLAGRRMRKLLVVAPVLIGVALLVPGVGSRLLTLSDITEEPGVAALDPSVVGRSAAQEAAFAMSVDHPLLGIGPGNFLLVEPEYLRRLGQETTPLAPHNLYLEATAETGLLGLLAWVLLMGSVVLVACRARLLMRAAPTQVQRAAPLPLTNAVIVATAGWALTSLFLHLATFRSFLVVAALAAALDVWARRAIQDWSRSVAPAAPESAANAPADAGVAENLESSAADPRESTRARFSRALALATTVLLIAATAIWVVADRGEPSWSARTSLRLVVKGPPGAEPPPYALDVLGRPAVVTTLAMMTAEPRFVFEGLSRLPLEPLDRSRIAVRVTNRPPSGLIEVTATAPDPAEATSAAAAVQAAAGEYVNSLSPLYGVVPSAPEPVPQRSAPAVDWRLALVPLGLAGVCSSAAWSERRRSYASPGEA